MARIILGTWQLSSSSWSTVDPAEVRSAIAYAIERGLSTFDTAPGYADGTAEPILGEIAAGTGADVRFISKVPPDMLRADLVRKSVEGTLEHLGVDSLDTVFIHWPAGSMGTELVPVEETLDALEALRSEGKISRIGLSNFSADEVRGVLMNHRIDALQHCYSLLWRACEFGLADIAREHRLTLYAYSPAATGLLFLRDIRQVVDAESDHRKHTKLYGKHAAAIASTLSVLSDRHGKDGRTLATAGMRWLIAKGAVPILGIKNADTVDFALAAAAAGPLDTAEVAELDALTTELKETIGEDYCIWG